MTESPEFARIRQLEAENRELKSDLAHALAEAKRRQPDYPFSQNTATEIVWALGEAYLGVESAIEQWIGHLHDRHELLREIIRVSGLPFIEAAAEWSGLTTRINQALASVPAMATDGWARQKASELTAKGMGKKHGKQT
jgi:hypothetical protein